jgi:RNA polymerase sigma-70 factor, ECF subfamily
LKVVEFNRDLKYWIDKAKNNDRQGQKVIYDHMAPKVLGICRRYIDDIYAAEDTMMCSFIKVFKSIDTYEGRGDFEAWVSRIAVFESITYLRSLNKYKMISPIDDKEFAEEENVIDHFFEKNELQWYVDQLPAGCRTVFVMSAIDGYKHNEISEILQISEGTSKSQLSYARKILKNLIQVKNLQTYE